METISCRTFFPISRANHKPFLGTNQRYRYTFGDRRLSRTAKRFLSRMISKRTSTISGCSRSKKEVVSIYRFLSNERVTLQELIHYVTDLTGKNLIGRELYVLLDMSSINMSLGPLNHSAREDWPAKHGVLDNNHNPGFGVMPSLIKDAHQGHIIGLGDILVHARQQATGSRKENKAASRLRQKLPLQHKESGAWSRTAIGTAAQLTEAAKVTYIMDQGGDDYASLATIRQQTRHDFIVRSKHNRLARLNDGAKEERFEALLDQQPVADTKVVEIKSLNHFSKTASSIVQRKARKSILHLKMVKVMVVPPRDVQPSTPILNEPIWLVEVSEDPQTVPDGEEPIRWKILTTWRLDCTLQAWKVADAYQQRWDIEQLFRVLKRQGFKIESSQLKHPDRIKKLTIMALSASVKSLQLVAARDGKNNRKAEEVFTPREIRVLDFMSKTLNGETTKTQNPHDNESLAWAAWIVARAGGWHGYASQRPPGPIIMNRGLRELETLVAYQIGIDDT